MRKITVALLLLIGCYWSANARMCLFDIRNCTFDSYRFSSGRGVGWSLHNSDNLACNIAGISTCSITTGTPGGTVSGSPSTNDGVYCWCALINPRAGRWIYLEANATTADCASDCAERCATNIQNDSAFRTAILALP